MRVSVPLTVGEYIMKLPQWCIDQLLNDLVKTLTCPSLPMACDDPHEWAWQVKDTEIQFVVSVKETFFLVEIYPNTILTSWLEMNEPEKVVREAKAFKSKYLSAN